jgi:hypothetical protein
MTLPDVRLETQQGAQEKADQARDASNAYAEGLVAAIELSGGATANVESNPLSLRAAADPSNAKQLFIATDLNGGTPFVSNGSSWIQVAKGVSEPTVPTSIGITGGRAESVRVIAAAGAALAVDLSLANSYDVKLSAASCRLTIVNAPAGAGNFDLLIRQDGTGGRAIVWDYGVRPTPVITTLANRATLLRFHTVDGGKHWVVEGIGAVDLDLTDLAPLAVTSASLVRWYKADAITPQGDLTALASWLDSGPNAVPLAQVTGTKQPLYVAAGIDGKPSVRADGVDDFLTSAQAIFSGAWHMFIVAKGPAQDTKSLLAQNAGGAWKVQFIGSGGGGSTANARVFYADAGNTLVQGSGTRVAWDNGWHLLQSISSGAGSFKPTVDNYPPTTTLGGLISPQAAALTLFAIASGATNFAGEVAEVLIYNGPLSVADQNTIAVDYLKAKYPTALAGVVTA